MCEITSGRYYLLLENHSAYDRPGYRARAVGRRHKMRERQKGGREGKGRGERRKGEGGGFRVVRFSWQCSTSEHMCSVFSGTSRNSNQRNDCAFGKQKETWCTIFKCHFKATHVHTYLSQHVCICVRVCFISYTDNQRVLCFPRESHSLLKECRLKFTARRAFHGKQAETQEPGCGGGHQKLHTKSLPCLVSPDCTG